VRAVGRIEITSVTQILALQFAGERRKQ